MLFLILWIIAGFFVGYFVSQVILAFLKAKGNMFWNIIIGLIGSLVAYTVLR